MNDTELNQHLSNIRDKGWTKINGVYEESLLERIKRDFEDQEHHFCKVQQRKGIADQTKNATHHTLLLCPSMLELLEENKIHPLLEAYFGGKYILSTMGLSRVISDSSVYTQNIHRDVRTYTADVPLWVNTLIMLDDSTQKNGATYMLEGSHSGGSKPDTDFFYDNAIRACGKRGDVLVFDGNIWHAAGQNITDKPRHIITPIYCRPFIKQQLDYPRAFGAEFGRSATQHLRQILGYNALVPASLDEFYQKDEDRYYKSDQG